MPCPDHDPCDILIVDDSPDARALLDGELSIVGYHVHTASSGEESLRHLRQHLPDAILLDVLMPGLDGFETCQRIRDLSEEIPIIFMTGLGETEHIVRGFACGGNDYVTKPVVIAEVIARVQAHTRTANLVRTTREAVNASAIPMLAFDETGVMLWINAAGSALLPVGARSAAGPLRDLGLHPMLALTDTRRQSVQFELEGQTLEAQRVSDGNDSIIVVSLQAQSKVAAGWRAPQLTAREGEVLLWVARGKTNRDIADILGMSPRTVNKHLEHIFEKLGVETRTAAADAARKMKLA